MFYVRCETFYLSKFGLISGVSFPRALDLLLGWFVRAFSQFFNHFLERIQTGKCHQVELSRGMYIFWTSGLVLFITEETNILSSNLMCILFHNVEMYISFVSLK